MRSPGSASAARCSTDAPAKTSPTTRRSTTSTRRRSGYPYTFGIRPGGFPFLDTSNGVGRSFLENAPFTHEEKAAIGSGNWERLTAHLGTPTTAPN